MRGLRPFPAVRIRQCLFQVRQVRHVFFCVYRLAGKVGSVREVGENRMSGDMKEVSFDLILDALQRVMEEVDDLEELHQKAMEIDCVLSEREGVLEARMAAQ
jgi:hypothetical protein